MSGKCKVLVFAFIAGFLLTISLPALAFSRQKAAKLETRQVEKATMVKSQDEPIGAAAESQPMEKSQEGESAMVSKSPLQEEETASEAQSAENEAVIESVAAEESFQTEDASPQKAQPEKEQPVETIVPSPKDIKEATAIYVFLGWMWLSILVLIYLLRLKVKETDRIHRLKFFTKN